MDQEKNKSIHVEVITGIIRMVREFRSNPDGYVLLSQAMLAGIEGISSEAIDHVFHFAQAWLDRSSSSMLDKIIAGDYLDLWAVVNAYLFRVGYPAITPVDIKV